MTTVEEIGMTELAWAMRLEKIAFPEVDQWSTEQYLELIEENGYALVAKIDGKPVGLIWMQDDDNSLTTDLIALAVEPAYRRQGIGRLLLEEAEVWASDGGSSVMTLQVRLDNPARGLYDDLGFEEVGIEGEYYTDGAACAHMIKYL